MGSKVEIAPVGNPENSSFVTKLNEAVDLLSDEFDKAIYRDGSLAMEGDFDMGLNHIYNLPAPVSGTSPVRLLDVPLLTKGEKGDKGDTGDTGDDGSPGISVEGSVATAATAFLATTTLTSASTPNPLQQPLYVPAGDYDGNTTITATGAAQVVSGTGNTSILRDTELKWSGFGYGGAHNLYLRGGLGKGITLEAMGVDRLSYWQSDNVTMRDKTVGLSLDGATTTALATIQLSNYQLIGNTQNLYAGHCANIDLVNFTSVVGATGDLMHGIGEMKVVNGRFQGTVDGHCLEIRGDLEKASLESYFTNCNFNHGSSTDFVAITEILPVSGGTRLQVTTAAPHNVMVGYAQFTIATGSAYAGRWAVEDVTGPNVAILEPVAGVSPVAPYVATEVTGTFNRRKAGLYLNGTVTAGGSYLNDLQFKNGSANETIVKDAYNIIFDMRAFGGKDRLWLEGQNNRILSIGSGRGRSYDTYADVLAAGPASHTGNSMLGVFDPTASLAPGGQHTGTMAPIAALGVAANNRPTAYAFSLTAESGHKIGVGAYPALDDYWQWKRANLASRLYMSAVGGVRMTSDDKVNGLEIVGANTGTTPAFKNYGPDTNISISYEAKGTGSHDYYMNGVRQLRIVNTASADTYLQLAGGSASATVIPGGVTNATMDVRSLGTSNVRLRSGAGTIQVQINNTGIGFFATTPVAKQTLAAAATDLATAITLVNSIRTALINYGLAS